MKKFIILFTPPIILKFFKKIKNSIFKTNVDNEEPTLNTIQGGVLKGNEIFIYNKKDWQIEMINGTYDQFFYDYLKKLDLKNKTILDIGAHIGYTSMAFAKLTENNGKVYAFEPNDYNIERMNINLKNNPDISDRIKIFNLAIADKKGEEEFIFSTKVEKGSSSGSFLDSAHTFWEKDIYEKKLGFQRKVVQTDSLDNLYQSKKITNPPALIKIDIEGAEYLALQGAEQTINQYKPIILIEIHSIFNMLKTGEMMNEWNYDIELLKEEKDGRCFLVLTPHESKVKSL
ncbi:hypothetical protein A2331_02740 [Candidatus Falkowbacteria bacterium RIFOXYB2_FULL_34_18]|uniref:Methyltransferase FkbM domain-containing protein n=1 Tax=Candidatus Falkowbacteria bacterium RIFOXYD2_FULL_34_120 TaxID=1798007 RepID=A0A1F5TRP9_9BACT|nr:MAG: hypothetical protein A2331_02740 [Candidatus Falkowbacteria bacterium RIFOXYB2_FULL_34_18]OGF29657.1 MAG: hypothetical protein A2500_00770 [Candidatus Falkowbacteria bacterium RIFOXYC12_FULL_34_55]OGF37384.1 MAG: hypothetical protein A2466_01540 [Candidatus Falkowbacteria bacterium RIFOXYC2_FULL_34_220]OGF39122.1 MAG: hypothetical protein A2515_00190 [Candidatus Falkowbacteria bacterium RIFOXYD12_FULL_34_57]OGF41646.1 MAG: hypothetical protein A2531_06425 [Candidatus Falkowbacteria bact